jgi:hypothetical protein
MQFVTFCKSCRKTRLRNQTKKMNYEALSFKYCECVLILTLIIGQTYLTFLQRITLSLWPVWLHHSFTHYFANGVT